MSHGVMIFAYYELTIFEYGEMQFCIQMIFEQLFSTQYFIILHFTNNNTKSPPHPSYASHKKSKIKKHKKLEIICII